MNRVKHSVFNASQMKCARGSTSKCHCLCACDCLCNQCQHNQSCWTIHSKIPGSPEALIRAMRNAQTALIATKLNQLVGVQTTWSVQNLWISLVSVQQHRTTNSRIKPRVVHTWFITPCWIVAMELCVLCYLGKSNGDWGKHNEMRNAEMAVSVSVSVLVSVCMCICAMRRFYVPTAALLLNCGALRHNTQLPNKQQATSRSPIAIGHRPRDRPGKLWHWHWQVPLLGARILVISSKPVQIAQRGFGVRSICSS
jgi:hypothetical protein